MKKKYRVIVYLLALVIFPAVCLPGYAAPGTDGSGGGGLENLAGKVSRGISDYFAGRGETDIRTAVIKFENFSEVSDLTAHKFYQLLVSRLETRPGITFTDLMINFHGNKGEFNLNRLDKLNYLVYIKLLKNKNKLGTGIAVFSRVLDKTVYIKYFEEPFSAGTRDIFETRNYGFKGLGFFKQVEIDAGKDLLDFKSVVNPGGQVKYFFYYPRKIDIFNVENNSFKKYFSFKLEWGRPYYPVMAYEGRLCLFYTPGNEALILTLG
ncbi:MAG: hypothetical protein GY950_09640, partial [bacterium]|nr:hypothetical protein [bacterium]